jgi:alpha-beta hydrolase superfamily lysophospholipase
LLYQPRAARGDETWEADLDQTRAELKGLSFRRGVVYPDATKRYFARYGLDLAGVRHSFGTFRHADFILAAHVFTPPSPRGTVIALHGYYDHAGTWRHAIRALVDAGYAVAIYDQPGHGLSTGQRGAIDDFCQYDGVLRCFTRICEKHLPKPFYLLAHSMGGAVVMDYLSNKPELEVRRTVLLAPLVRSAAWAISGAGIALSDPFVSDVPRVFRKNSSNTEFLEFMRKDPLQARRVPFSWVHALRRWNRRMEKREASPHVLVVLQGTMDSTVDWRYNRQFVERKFSNARVVLIQGAGHQLLNETPSLRTQVLTNIVQFLEADFPADGP